jgi:hypothetical protein
MLELGVPLCQFEIMTIVPQKTEDESVVHVPNRFAVEEVGDAVIVGGGTVDDGVVRSGGRVDVVGGVEGIKGLIVVGGGLV